MPCGTQCREVNIITWEVEKLSPVKIVRARDFTLLMAVAPCECESCTSTSMAFCVFHWRTSAGIVRLAVLDYRKDTPGENHLVA